MGLQIQRRRWSPQAVKVVDLTPGRLLGKTAAHGGLNRVCKCSLSRLSAFERIQYIHTELAKITHISAHDGQPVRHGCRCDHGVFDQSV